MPPPEAMDRPADNSPRRKSIRVPDYDYTLAGSYFLTICAAGMRCVFGQVAAEGVRLSPLGEAIRDCWLQMPRHFETVELDEFVIMPNHLHAILVNWAARDRTGTACRAPADPRAPEIAFPPYRTAHPNPERFGKPVAGSLPTMVRSFKSAATKAARERRLWDAGPLWQRGYYEHIIRKTESLQEIRAYIRDNPQRWFEKHNGQEIQRR